ncbi:MAG: hypothetical protein CME82_14980 [Halomonas sp.]|nr:hypothetical protein [Halomonas sp.]
MADSCGKGGTAHSVAGMTDALDEPKVWSVESGMSGPSDGGCPGRPDVGARRGFAITEGMAGRSLMHECG